MPPKRQRREIECLKMPQTAAAAADESRTDFELARERLHVSAVPESLPCRDAEFAEITMHIESALRDEHGCCIYISGTPGTGKTATVRRVIAALRQRIEEDDLPSFDDVELNGMKMADASYIYSALWLALSKEKTTPAQAQALLEQRFLKSRRKYKPCIVVVDELDLLVTRKQTIMYNLFNWPNAANSNFIVITIANTMDLPERFLSNKISSRLGLTRINFQPYTFAQLTEIIASRLSDLKIFEPTAITFCARKVGAVSGDARRALDICRRAAEVVQVARGVGGSVDITVIDKVIKDMYASIGVRAIASASVHQKIFIYSLMMCLRQSGLSEGNFGETVKKHIELCRLHNIDPPSVSDLATVCSALASAHLVLLEGDKADLYSRIRFYVSEEDIIMTFRADEDMRRFALP